MKNLILFIIFFSVHFTTIAQQIINGTLVHDNVERNYILHIPASYDEHTSVPLIFSFHGFGSSAAVNKYYNKLDLIADTAGFIVAYPQGELYNGSTHWNVGGFTLGSKVDDVGFTAALLDSISTNYNINSERVYSCGMSNGGYMSFLLACQMSDKFAAIASVTGSMSPQTYRACNPKHPIPILQIHGDADTTVPYQGALWTKSIDDVLQYWTNYNNCNPIARITDVPDINQNDGSTMKKFEFNDGDNSSIVEHFKVFGGGHTWPGVWGNLDIDASKEIWRFFSEFDIDGLLTTTVKDNNPRKNDHFHIFPNPCQDILTIKDNYSSNMDFEIISLLGEVKLTGKIIWKTQEINVTQLDPNIYFIKIGNEIIKFAIAK